MNARIQTGMIVLANVCNPFENKAATGKPRPAVVVSRDGGHFNLVCLTTNPRFRTGVARVAIPDPIAQGLHRPGFLWGDRCTRVSAIDVDRQIGWCTPGFAEVICDHVRLSRAQASELIDAANDHALSPAIAA